MRAALTFDAEHPSRPHWRPGNEDAILDTLRRMDVPATFFVQGRWAKVLPETARRIVEDGHLVGNHSLYHARMPFLTDEGLRADVTGAEVAIREIMGVDPRPLFRLPFGHGQDDDRILQGIRDLGYRHCGWQVDPNDWDPGRTSEDLQRHVVDGVRKAGEGAVVLFHTWPRTTPEALPAIVERLRAASFTFCRLDGLEGFAASGSQ